MDGTYVRCPKLLIKVAMVQCYRLLDASVPSNAVAGTFTIGLRNLNLYVCAICHSILTEDFYWPIGNCFFQPFCISRSTLTEMYKWKWRMIFYQEHRVLVFVGTFAKYIHTDVLIADCLSTCAYLSSCCELIGFE